MKPHVLYAGDTALTAAAAYLAGVMAHHGIAFDYVAGDEPIGPHLRRAEASLYIISDYPVKHFRRGDFARLREAVAAGAGLLMIGGWESFRGISGGYSGTPLAEILPVEMEAGDDRVNSAQPVLIEKVCDHAIVRGLPFDRPPGVGGYNRVRAKRGATTVLVARHIAVRRGRQAGAYAFKEGRGAPLLVVGTFGRGRTAAFTSDVAPHWVGGFVDWGNRRVTARARGAGEIEVGNWYAEFFARLVRWTARGLGDRLTVRGL